ncbi:hypothetical protein [Massilia sp. Mn16-1_5]|uniref:hypothetical protein n=1 Tax=Massilia sp. Mn16-1_5 TaxID=2079199 RepID=UPI00109E8C55|nr:hypothetical protein [Massilia sp. Mn16-1_5]
METSLPELLSFEKAQLAACNACEQHDPQRVKLRGETENPYLHGRAIVVIKLRRIRDQASLRTSSLPLRLLAPLNLVWLIEESE